MIFYKNLKKHKTPQEKDIVFSIFDEGLISNKDNSLAKPTQCEAFYNLTFLDGALKTGMGFEDLTVPNSYTNFDNVHGFDFSTKMNEIDGIWMDRYFNPNTKRYMYQLMMIDPNFKIWGVPLIDEWNGRVWSKSDKLSSYPTSQSAYRINNEDAFIMFSEEGMLYLALTAEGIYTVVPPFISSVVHYDNFFGITNTNRNTLVYTKNLNLKQWSDDNLATIEFLDNRGSFNKLVAFNDYVYLFREYGITKISLYSSSNDFSFTHLYTSTSKIYENSVCVCGDKVMFMTRDGLYTFNGNAVNKVADEYDVYFKNLSNENCSAACLNGKYYLATKCNFKDEKTVGCEETTFVNNVLFEIDVNNFAMNLYRGVDIRKILSIDTPFMSKLCACFYNDYKLHIGQLTFNGKTFTNSNEKFWQSFSTDLGFQGKRKRVKEIIIDTSYDIDVEIKSDEETKTYHFAGKNAQQRKKISVYGKNFQFSFKTTNQCDVKKPMFIFDVVS